MNCVLGSLFLGPDVLLTGKAEMTHLTLSSVAFVLAIHKSSPKKCRHKTIFN